MLKPLIDKLAAAHSLSLAEYRTLLTQWTPTDADYLKALARQAREQVYGKDVYIRGLIEISNICKNDCYYCGIRASNTRCDRYRLTPAEILACTGEGYVLGFRTFVLQGGEDGYFTDDLLCALIEQIKARHPDCAVTLSLGERPFESYARLKAAGADRYLLRHETVNPLHYGKLHPPALSWQNRMDCLKELRRLNYQVGCGFMVGSPYQTPDDLAEELKFIETFRPDMCGIGPFLPHQDTPFHASPAGSAELTCLLLACIRLIHPQILLPATTALGTRAEDGREQGILSGANVVMPNLSPSGVRKKYMLYNDKLSDGAESAQAVASLRERIQSVGYRVVTARGDVKQ